MHGYSRFATRLTKCRRRSRSGKNASGTFPAQAFACEMDARTAWEKALKGQPSWLKATFTLSEHKQYQQRGRPKKEAVPDQTV